MTIRRVRLIPLSIPLRRPHETGAGSMLWRDVVLVELETRSGISGLGEAPVSRSSGSDQTLQRVLARSVLGTAIEDVPLHKLGLPRPVATAIDVAVWDIRGKAERRTVAQMLGGTAISIPVNATVSIRNAAEAAAASQRAVRAGFRTIKLKVGYRDAAEDIRRVEAVREAIGPMSSLRIDANGQWDVPTAIRTLERLAPYDLEYIEQPGREIADLAAIRRHTSVPVAADECASDLESVESLLAAEAADVIVVKPLVVGGITPAREIIAATLRAGTKAVVTTSIDTGVGIAAAAQLAATLPYPVPACGLATAELLESDVLQTPIRVQDGMLLLPEEAGLGIALDDKAIELYRMADTA